MPYTVRSARWPEDADALRGIRYRVFVVEQAVPEALEWDGRDAACLHALAHDEQGEVIGCGRLLPDGHIGRMAVVPTWRGKGVGSALLQHLVEVAAAAGHAEVALNAQTHAVPFYTRLGFVPDGPVFMEAGIPHQAMRRVLAA